MKYERITGKSCVCVCASVCLRVCVYVTGASSSSAVVVVIVGVGFHSADKWTWTTKGGRPRLTGRQARRTGKEANEQAKVPKGNEEQSVKECRERKRERRRDRREQRRLQIKTETPSEESFLHSPANCSAGEGATLKRERGSRGLMRVLVEVLPTHMKTLCRYI